MSTYSIGISALAAAQAGLTTTEHNISNVNTLGYNRQQIVQSANVAQYSGSGFFGQGVHVDTVKRVYDQMLAGQVMQAQTQSSQLESYSTQIQQLDNLLADPSAGLSPALQGFFNGVQDVASNPASVPSRQAMLSGAQTMVARFQAINQRFTEIRDGVNSQVTSSVGVVNSYAKEIANLNQLIVVAQGAAGDQQPPNDLLDQRDQLIGELNQIVKVSTVKQDDGSLNVFIGNGQSLVLGNKSFTLGAAPSLEDPAKLDVGMISGGSTVLFQEGSLTGGTLGGLLAFRDETLDPAQNALGRVAIGLAQTFNDQHKLGMDLNGNLGGDFFNVSAPKVIPNAENQTTSGVPVVTLTDIGNVTTSDYTLSYNGTNYALQRKQDGLFWNETVVNPGSPPPPPGAWTLTGAPITFTAPVDGMTITAPAAAAANDKWLIKPTIDGARDISVILTDTSAIAAAAPISTNAPLTNAGTGTISARTVTAVDVIKPLTDITLTFDSAAIPPGFIVGNADQSTLPYNPITDGGGKSFTLTQNGWSIDITLSGTPLSGPPADSFTVGPNTGGKADSRNALLLAGLQTKNTLAGGSTDYQGAYSQLVSSVGNKTSQVQVEATAQANLLSQTQQAQQSLSGVNLDEEAANLLRYQQAYQAAGKMMQIATTLFATLLSLGQ